MSPAPATARIKVAVCEDQPHILKSQLKILQDSPELEVIGTALSGEAILELLKTKQPDVLLQDLGLPRMTGIEVTREVKRNWPAVEVLIFTIFDEEEKVIEAVKAGASGYLLKGTSAEKVVEAIREVKSGGSVIQPSLARRLLKHFHVPEDATAVAARADAGKPRGARHPPAHRARDRDPAADREGPLQQRGRRRPGALARDGAHAPRAHLREAGGDEPGGGRHRGFEEGLDRDVGAAGASKL